MRAVEIAEPGGPEVLRPCRRPVPTPAQGEVLIRVQAAGVNRPDVLQRRGLYPPPPGVSDLPGLEVAGEIAALGSEVDRWRVGDSVCALLAGGGYAAYAVAPAVQCLPIPRGLSALEAASLPETLLTVWANVFHLGAFRPGDTVLIHGGTSGVGVAAIQLVSAFGGRAFATAGTEEKARTCEALGAERGIDYRAEDFVAVLTEAGGADLILDMVGGDYLPRNLEAAAPGGRIVSIAALRGGSPPLDIGAVMRKRLTLTGSTLRARSVAEKGALCRELEKRVWPLLASGRVRPVVHAAYPIDQAAEAHRTMEASTHTGKLVLTVSD